MKRFLAVAALLVASTLGAVAADMAPRTYTKAPPLPVEPAPTWTGWYIGVNGGWGWAASDNVWTLDTPSGGNGSTGAIGQGRASGGLVGGQIGYNYQFAPSWVAGIQFDGDWANISGLALNPGVQDGRCGNGVGDQTADCRTTYTYLMTLTGRLGYLITPAMLLYGKGGVAFTGIDLRVNNVIDTVSAGCGVAGTNNGGYSTNHLNRTGYTVGGGLEAKFAEHWTVFGEYDYVGGLGGSSTNLNTGGSGASGCTADFTSTTTISNLNIVKAGVSYKFW